MRILMACAAFPPFMDGGGPISALFTAQVLINAGHDVLVVNVGDQTADETYDGIRVRRLSRLNIYWNYRVPRPAWKKLIWHALENFNPRAFFAMRGEIKRFQPDIVLTDSIENINVATWAAARSLRVPTCHILRSTFLICWKGCMMRGARPCAKQCGSCRVTSIGKWAMSRLVDGVIGETSFIVERHRAYDYFPHAQARVIPGVVRDAPKAAPRSRSGSSLRVGFIGVHTPMKGLETLAAAARRVVADNAQVEFLIAGSGNDSYAAAIPDLFPSAHTRFLGWMKPEEFFPLIDVLVVPSRFEEPFGRVIIEAFSHGVPVLGARSGGIPETITPSHDGFVFEAGDDKALADLICELASNEHLVAALSEGASRAVENYVPERAAPRYTEFLDSLVAPKRGMHGHSAPGPETSRTMA
jgi:glycosyltransferase involved in cell wall biosynthesis